MRPRLECHPPFRAIFRANAQKVTKLCVCVCVFVNNKADPGVTRLHFGMGIEPLPKRLEGPVTQRRRSNTNPHTLLQEADHRVSFYRLVPGRNLVTETGRFCVHRDESGMKVELHF